MLSLSMYLIACSGSKTIEEHIASARQLMAEEAFSEATVELKAALNKDVRNAEARALLGQAYFELRDFSGADKELTRTLEAGGGVDRAVVVPLLARTLMQLGEYERVDNLDVTGLSQENRSKTLAAKGLARLFQGDEVAAAEIIRTAESLEPVPLFTQVASARFSMSKGDFGEAAKKLNRILKAHDDYLPAWNLRGDLYAAMKKPAKAAQAYSRVLGISGRAFDARLNRAMMRIYIGEFNKARDDLNKLERFHRNVTRDHPGFSFARGITLMEQRRYVQARKAFEKTVDYSYAYPLSYYYMAVIDLQQGSLERALTEIYRFLSLAPESVAGPKLAARLELEQQGFHEAEQLLSPIVELYPTDIEALNLLATAKLGLGKGGQGVQLLQRVAELKPDSSRAQARLSAGYFATGEVELGIETLEDILDRNPEFHQADILLVLNYLKEGEVDKAVKAALKFKNRNPGSTISFNLLGRAYMADGNYEGSNWAYHKALDLDATDIGARHGLAELALKQGKFERARYHYNHVLKYNEDDLQTQLKLASSFALQGDEVAMQGLLEIAIQDHPESTEPLLMLIRYFVAADRLDEAKPYVEQLIVTERDQPDALATLAGYQIATGQYHQALITLERLLIIRPDVSQYHFMLAKTYSMLGDSENAMFELVRTVELEPEHFYAKIALARLALQGGQIRLFNKRLRELRKIAPGNPDVVQLEAAAARQKGDEKRVGNLFKRLYTLSPSSETAISYAEYRFQAGDGTGAMKLLQKWIEDQSDDVLARQKLAEFYVTLGHSEWAREQYEAILKVDHDNLLALNNLAWEYLERDPVTALRYAERAVDLAPESAAVLDTLAMAQLKTGQPAVARRTLQRALDKSPNDPELLFHEVQIMIAEGQYEGAVHALNGVLAQHGDFSARPQAEAMLRRLQ